ncbi:uncharacterized protein LOC117469165 [Xyrichtys novacula]|uniref:Uncharacterized protein LOC117469165 n=1 Tax=Xyrichtys novacula TaxID=13765 RepID=A0AAV1GL35_XYRNO|nr:uncharacterized protein LOC117469165 [Xyrichtys novacula]
MGNFLPSGVSCEDLTPLEKEKFSLEGSSVTLNYNYSKLSSGDYFYWYLQYPGTPPQFLISHSGSGTPISNPVPRLSFKVKMDHWLWIILAALFFECKGEDSVTQTEGAIFAFEGHTVTLNCTFETSRTVPTLFWYRQDLQDFPEYMLKSYSETTEFASESDKDRFNATIKGKSVNLEIQNLHLSDSAVYYCALQPTVTGNTKALYKNPRKHNTPQHPLEGVTPC